MLVALGWVLLTGLTLSSQPKIDDRPLPPRPTAAGWVSVWADRDEPYRWGQGARVYLRAEQPGHVAVFRVDTDGRIRTLFPREPWGETYVPEPREFEIHGRGNRSFVVDDHPGVGYLFAIASDHPFDFTDIARGDYWDYRLIEDGRVQGDPYVILSDLAARVAREGDYDYDINPYYVEERYEYPRFLCYDCHAYAEYDEWDPYRQTCARYRMEIYDDPRYYPYRQGKGRNVVINRPARPGPRYVFRDAEPEAEYVTRVPGTGPAERRRGGASGRTSLDVGGRGAVPAPSTSAASESRPPRVAQPLGPTRGRAPESGRPAGRRAVPPAQPGAAPEGLKPTDERPRDPAARPRAEPQSTGEPELRRRRP